MIFSRRRSDGRDGQRQSTHTPAHVAKRRERTEFGAHDATVDADEAPVTAVTSGPYDSADAPAGQERLDLGSLLIPATDGVEVRVQASPEGQVQQVVLLSPTGAAQVGVFAAPRSEGIWDEVRGEIRDQLGNDGAEVSEADGEYGVELRARVKAPDGGVNDLRFVGIDGPRWMIRVVFQGPAAVDPAAAGPLTACVRGLVVQRGKEAMPVREPLPMRLPREVHDHARHAEEGPDAHAGAGEGASAADGRA